MPANYGRESRPSRLRKFADATDEGQLQLQLELALKLELALAPGPGDLTATVAGGGRMTRLTESPP